MYKLMTHAGLCALVALAMTACAQTEAPASKAADKAVAKTAKKAEAKKADTPAAPKAGRGIDIAKKIIKIGILNDESGPAAVIGKPFGVGKRVLAAQVNAGNTDILPAGWKVELVERDHGYNPGKAQQAYDAIKDDILFLGLSFGTPPTLPLRPFLEKDGIVAFPASLSSLMASHRYTPPAGPTYQTEAHRALDWAITHAGGADKLKAAIVYQQDDYGKDGYAGWTAAAKAQGVAVVAEQAIKPGQKDFTAVIADLKGKGATHIFLAILPSATGPILGTAAQMKFMPNWIGATPSWIDAFFAHPKLPPVVFTNFYWASSVPFWGEKLPGMTKFLESFKTHGSGARPDFYLLMSYLQGRISLEAAKRAIEAGDVTRAGYLKALQSVKGWNGGGMLQPVDMSAFPYVVGTKARVLKPDFIKKTWTIVADYAAPSVAAAK